MGATEAHTGELAAGVARLGTETAFSVLAKARGMERAGRDVIHLGIGEPDFDTPAHITEAAAATPVALPLREELGFSFALEDLEARLSDRTKLVILNSPQNPTGGVTPAVDLAAAAAAILETRSWVLTDEVYARLTYGDAFASIAG